MRTVILMIALIVISCTKTITTKPVAKRADPCYPDVNLNGVTYSVSPCTINDTLIHGNGDKPFTVVIKTSTLNPLYGFSVFGYGVGFPTYGITGVSSGGAQGNTTLNLNFRDGVLKKGLYKGYLPIHIFNGSEMGGEDSTRYLKVIINLIVK